eukprot:30918-Pelagococcus_subviridis.AAC.58
MPTFRFGFFSSDNSPARGLPRIITSPSSGASKPAMILNIVLFPVPDDPMIPTASPRRILKLAPSRTTFLPNFFFTFLSSIRTSPNSSSPAPPATFVPGSASARRTMPRRRSRDEPIGPARSDPPPLPPRLSAVSPIVRSPRFLPTHDGARGAAIVEATAKDAMSLSVRTCARARFTSFARVRCTSVRPRPGARRSVDYCARYLSRSNEYISAYCTAVRRDDDDRETDRRRTVLSNNPQTVPLTTARIRTTSAVRERRGITVRGRAGVVLVRRDSAADARSTRGDAPSSDPDQTGKPNRFWLRRRGGGRP